MEEQTIPPRTDENFQPRLDLQEVKEMMDKIRGAIGNLIVGQSDMIELLMVALLANGHVLIEGNPGLAKTLTAKLIAQAIDTDFKRIQFTPDLMPSDIIGTSVYNFQTAHFEFKKGPVFSNIVLIDEINRAPAKTQAALFEVMEEHQVSIDGRVFRLEDPFFIVATQNPIDMEGTYQLPEAQMDRFLFKINIDYPNLPEETEIIKRHHLNRKMFQTESIAPVTTAGEILKNRLLLDHVIIEERLINFIANLTHHTRNYKDIDVGASPRASLALLNASKAYAILQGRDYVIPEDILWLAPHVLNHRIILSPEKEMEGATTIKIIRQMLQSIEIPR